MCVAPRAGQAAQLTQTHQAEGEAFLLSLTHNDFETYIFTDYALRVFSSVSILTQRVQDGNIAEPLRLDVQLI